MMTPEDAVRGGLVGRPRTVPAAAKKYGSGVVGYFSRDVPADGWTSVRQDTIHFLRSKYSGDDRACFAVTYEDDTGMRYRMIAPAAKRGDGTWQKIGGSGGGARDPIRGMPWINMSGGWGRDGFHFGGPLLEDDGRTATVRLTDAQGQKFLDQVENSVALFVGTIPVEMVLLIEMIDGNGEVFATQEWGMSEDCGTS